MRDAQEARATLVSRITDPASRPTLPASPRALPRHLVRRDLELVPVRVGNVNRAGGYHSLVLLGESQRDRPRLLQPSPAAGWVHLPLATTRGKRYLLESKGTLLNAQWTWDSIMVGDGHVRSFTDALGSAPQRFYRVRQID